MLDLDLLLDFYLLQESHMVLCHIFVFFKMNFVFEYQLFEVLCDFIVHLNMFFFFFAGLSKSLFTDAVRNLNF